MSKDVWLISLILLAGLQSGCTSKSWKATDHVVFSASPLSTGRTELNRHKRSSISRTLPPGGHSSRRPPRHQSVRSDQLGHGDPVDLPTRMGRMPARHPRAHGMYDMYPTWSTDGHRLGLRAYNHNISIKPSAG